MQDEGETRATFEIVPDEVRTHIASYLDTLSLCFFAGTSQPSLGNTLAELKQRRRRMLAQMPLLVGGATSTFCYTLHSLYACGENNYGQLGLGHTNDCKQLTRAENVPGTILQVVIGIEHTFMLTDQGLYACGSNGRGELGLGYTNDCNQLTRVEDVPGTILQVLAGDSHTFVLTDQGLYACVDNRTGQLGLGDENDRHTFSPLSELPTELKQWLSYWQQLNHLIAFSTREVTDEPDEPETLPLTAKGVRIG